MQEKLSSPRLFHKRTKKHRKKRITFIFDPRSPKPPPPPPPAPVKAHGYHFVNSFVPKYDSARKGNCLKCAATTSTLWRRGPSGPETLCNRCGIRWKKLQEKMDKTNNKTKAKSRLQITETAVLGNSHYILLRPSENNLADREVHTITAEKHQQQQKDEQNGNIPNKQLRDKLSISFLLN